MALSNWATIAFNKDGELSEGIVEIKNKKQSKIVEIRKNWIGVKDSSVSEYNVATIESGKVHVIDFEIYAKRSYQNSVFCLTSYYPKGYAEGSKKKYFAGIGAYAFSGDKEVGVEKRTYKQFIKWIEELAKDNWFHDEEEFKEWFKKIKKYRYKSGYNQGTLYLAKAGFKL